jgi:tellurite resistance-related uncharacterized protein
MIDFVLDDEGDWIARLSCGHSQHVRHRPPFQERSWVLDEQTRHERLGTFLSCPLCDRAELPRELHLLRKSPVWDNVTAPSALRDSHHLAEGTWGVITVENGRLRLLTHGEVAMNEVIETNTPQAIPPGLDHLVKFEGPVRFSIDYLSVKGERFEGPLDEIARTLHRRDDSMDDESDEGGESACFAHLVCTVCGAVLESDSHVHRVGFDVNRIKER